MAWILRSIPIVLCLTVGEGAEQMELKDKAAQISVAVLKDNSGTVFNTSYFLGVFGDNSLTGPASGQLVHVRSEDNANHGCRDYNHQLPTHDWVALIERGSCVFSEKVRVATKQYSASAVIIYDNQPHVDGEMVLIQSDVKDEVYVFVVQSTGDHLASLVDSGLHVRVNITPADASSFSPLPVPSPSILLTFLAAGWLLCHCR